AFQLTALVNIGGVTWSMSPSVGSLTSGGLYTPPAAGTITSPTTTVITATSTVNASATASMTVTVGSSTAILMLPSQASNCTDSAGNVWYGGAGVGTRPTVTLRPVTSP